MIRLREYQEKAVDMLRGSIRSGHSRPILCLPTGAGKSIIFAEMISSILGNGKGVLWLVHRRNLVYQMRDVLRQFDIEPGLIMAGNNEDSSKQVQLGTIQTYRKRIKDHGIDSAGFEKFRFDILLIDECHRSLSKTYVDVIDSFKGKFLIGCTATPMRADQRGMGQVYDDIVCPVDVTELTDQGFLAPARYFAPSMPDLQNVPQRMGDYVVKDLEIRVNTKKLNGNVVSNYLLIGEGRKALVFAVNVRHSMSLCEEFINYGIPAEHLDAKSSDEDREAVFVRVQNGNTKVVCNVALYQEGLDVPDVSYLAMARPTKSLGLWRQCAGRVLRPSAGKKDCIIADHGGVIEQNGFIDEPIIWSLDGKRKAYKINAKKKERQKCRCKSCNLVFEGSSVCPDCGSPVKRMPRRIDSTREDLKEIERKNKAAANKVMSWADKRRFMAGLVWYEKNRGWNPGRKAHLYKIYFGVWPNDKRVRDVMPIEPDDKTMGLIKHVLIKSSYEYKHKKAVHMRRPLMEGK